MFPVVGREKPDLSETVRKCKGEKGENTHLGEHPGEGSGRVCSSGKPKNADFVAKLV